MNSKKQTEAQNMLTEAVKSELIEEIKIELKKNKTIEEVAEALEIDTYWLKIFAVENNLIAAPLLYKKKSVTKKEIEGFIQEYDPKTYKEIADYFNYTISGIKYLLSSRGIEFKPKQKLNTKTFLKHIEEYPMHTLSDITSYYDVDYTTVLRLANRHKIDLTNAGVFNRFWLPIYIEEINKDIENSKNKVTKGEIKKKYNLTPTQLETIIKDKRCKIESTKGKVLYKKVKERLKQEPTIFFSDLAHELKCTLSTVSKLVSRNNIEEELLLETTETREEYKKVKNIMNTINKTEKKFTLKELADATETTQKEVLGVLQKYFYLIRRDKGYKNYHYREILSNYYQDDKYIISKTKIFREKEKQNQLKNEIKQLLKDENTDVEVLAEVLKCPKKQVKSKLDELNIEYKEEVLLKAIERKVIDYVKSNKNTKKKNEIIKDLGISQTKYYNICKKFNL